MENGYLTVARAAEVSGVTIRTLRYYDRIGLLAPDKVSEAGYRLYAPEDLNRLRQILFFREAGFELKQIARIMRSPGFDQREALKRQIDVLALKRDRLNNLIAQLRRALEGRPGGFEAFDIKEEERMRDAYEEEVTRRWGDTKAFRQSRERGGIDPKGMMACFTAFLPCVDKDPGCPEAREAVKGLKDYITRTSYDCTDEILLGLGQMYVQDERFARNINDCGDERLADFVSRAIERYVNDPA